MQTNECAAQIQQHASAAARDGQAGKQPKAAEAHSAAMPAPAEQPRRFWLGVACGVGSALIWGAFPVMTRLGVAYSPLDALDIVFIRYFFSGLLLAPFLLRKGLGGIPWWGLALMVLGIGAPYMLVVAQGLRQAPVEQFASIVPASMIVFSLAISMLLLRTRLRRNEWLGIALIVIGMAAVALHSMRTAGLGAAQAYGLFLLGGLLWAVYTVTAKALCRSAFHATAIVSVLSMLAFAPLYLHAKGLALLAQPWQLLLPHIVYQGFFVSILALYLYSQAVLLLGPAVGSLFAALVPGLATVIAALFLHEQPALATIAGLLLVTLGMGVALFRARPAPAR
ncbi:DMT family transporter [Vandammella animalimorsus]|nr:DMT family transporter [Vandammella animalimorsus]